MKNKQKHTESEPVPDKNVTKNKSLSKKEIITMESTAMRG